MRRALPVYSRAMLRATLIFGLLIGLMCAGCSRVQRTLSVNSDPPGALLFMNDQELGRTPVTRDFIWYGWYDVTLRKEGFKTLKTRAKVIAPAWQFPPFDLLAEFSPARLKDRHQLTFTLEPEDEPPSSDEMLGRAEQLRLQLESSQYTRNPATRPVTQPATQMTIPSTTQSTTEPATTQSTQPATTESTQPATTQSTTAPAPATTPAPPPPTQPMIQPPMTQPTTRRSFL